MGPGWSLPGDTDTTGQGILGGSPIKDLLAAGYNVLTWDPRGFGQSAGRPRWTAPPTRPGTSAPSSTGWPPGPVSQLDRPGDPRMGMVGGSYGGGIQFVTAATDCRVDAIVPTIAWHSLTTSLDKAGTAKSGWSGILTNLSTSDHVDPEVMASYQSGVVDRRRSPRPSWPGSRPAVRPSCSTQVHIPTLIVQGTVDTLFTLQEGVDNYEALKAERRDHVDALVLRRPRGVPDPGGRPRRHRAGHASPG